MKDSSPQGFAWCIARHAASTPDAVAFVTATERVTYGELEQRIGSLAGALAAAGVAEHDRVGVCAHNRPEIVELLFACARVGATLVVLNNRLTRTEIDFQLGDATPTLVLHDAAFVDRFKCDQPHVRDLDDFVSDARVRGAHAPPEPVGTLAHPALLMYTSGTTGQPKGAVLSQRSLLYTIDNAIAHEGFDADSVVLAVLPMFHVGGLNIQLMPCLFQGGTVVLEQRFEPHVVLERMRTFRPSHLVLVPVAMQAVLGASPNVGADFGSLGALACGSSIVPHDLIRRFMDRGVDVVQVYGATETGPTAVVLEYEDAHQIGSCGTPAKNTEVRIVNGSGEPAATDEVGELQLRGPNLFDGYWQQPEATSDAFDDGWYRTGDLGYVDLGGYTYITGRVKELIISGGENIYPAEIEQVINAHPDVVQSAVVGVPDERWGEAAVAHVVFASGASATVSDIGRWTRERLAGFKQPRQWIVHDQLPMTSLGKVQKHELAPPTDHAH